MERVLVSDTELLAFAPEHPTRKGTVLGQLWFLPTSKTMLIDFKLFIR